MAGFRGELSGPRRLGDLGRRTPAEPITEERFIDRLKDRFGDRISPDELRATILDMRELVARAIEAHARPGGFGLHSPGRSRR